MARYLVFGFLILASFTTKGQGFSVCPDNDYRAPLLAPPADGNIDWIEIRGNYWKGELTPTDTFLPTRPFHCFADTLSNYFLNAEHRTDSTIITPKQSGFYTFTIHAEFTPIALLLKGQKLNSSNTYPCEDLVAGQTTTLQDSSFSLGVNLISLSTPVRAGLNTIELPQLRFGAYLEKDTSYTLMITSKDPTQRGHYLFHFFTPDQVNFNDTLFTVNHSNVLEAVKGWLPHTLERFDWPDLFLPKVVTYQTDSIGRLLAIQPEDSTILVRTGYPHLRTSNLEVPDSVLNGVNFYGKLRDTCNNITVYVIDSMTTSGDCSTTQIQRNFQAVDAAQNRTATLSQTLTFATPKKENIQYPPIAVTVSCGSSTDPDLLGQPNYWNPSGWIPADRLAPLAITYEDGAQVNACSGTYSFSREWSIYHWCQPSKSHIFTQVIHVVDTTAPEFIIPASLTINTYPANCKGGLNLPLPTEWADNCSTPSLVGITGTVPVVQYQGIYTAANLDTGEHLFTYTVADACGNTSIQNLTVQVVDSVSPTLQCDDEIQISLGDSLAIIEASRFAEGAFENCGEIALAVSHNGSEWQEHIPVDCDDNGTYLSVKATQIGTALSSYCRIKLTIVDQQPVTCIPPDSVTIQCDNWIYDTTLITTNQLDALFGTPSGKGNCSWQIEELDPNFQLDLCGVGEVTRTFVVRNGLGQLPDTCQQIIELQPHHNYTITFPANRAIQNCNAFSTTPPSWTATGCDLLTISSDTALYTASSQECYQFFVTYRLINWCEYEEGAPIVEVPNQLDSLNYLEVVNDTSLLNGFPFHTSTGFWEYEQRIEVRDTVAPKITFPTLAPICAYGSCLARVELPFNISDNCSTRDLQFRFFYDAYRDETYDDPITFFAEDPIQDSLYGVYGRAPKLRMIGYFPVGAHYLVIEASDGCGNLSRSLLPFEVIDCKGPAPICIEGLAVELMPSETGPEQGMAQVKATDFLLQIPDDCTGPVSFSIHPIEDSIAIEQTELELSCADVGTMEVKIVGWDGVGNADYCITTLDVQDNLFPICQEEMGMQTGQLMTPTGMPLSGVSVRYSNQTYITDTDGRFLYPENAMETVMPLLEDDPLMGISTYDLILISGHILGIHPIEDHTGLIAADVNQSGTISTLDLIELRKLILRMIPRLSGAPVWHYLTDAGPKEIDTQWTAIKSGDVNHSYMESVMPRTTITLDLKNQFVEAGETFEFTLQHDFFADYKGGQMTINYNPEYLDVKEAGGNSANQHWDKNGNLHLSWLETDWQKDWTYSFKALKSGYLSEWISINSNQIKPEVYSNNGTTLGLEWNWETTNTRLQLGPNPFSEGTNLYLWADTFTEATVYIYDESGQNIWKQKEILQIGANALYISRTLLGQPGIYVVQVDMGQTQWTTKMVFVK